MATTRRSFMMGCSAAIAAMACSRLSFAAFGDPDASREVLVTIVLRGGADLLSLVAPIDGLDRGHDLAARPQLALPTAGDDVPPANDAVYPDTDFGRQMRMIGQIIRLGIGLRAVTIDLGSSVNGGLYGAWPGFAPDALYDGADGAVTTDYRRILAEIVVRRFGNPYLSQVFPGYGYAGYSPLGIVSA